MSTQHSSVPLAEPSSLLTTGLALFSMFFGAGNLIFPLLIGKAVGSQSGFAILGLGLTAVAVPFIGLAAMLLFKADTHQFFGRIGKIPGSALLLLLQLILGPFGVIPRLVTLMHAMAKPYFMDIPLMAFSLLIAGAIYLCSFRRQKLIGYLGALTPILLLCIAALVILGFAKSPSFQMTSLSAGESFWMGLIGGYNTMDLIAAFMFATVILPHFRAEIAIGSSADRGGALLRKMILPASIAASLLFLTYIGLCLISAFHGETLSGSVPSEQLLSLIAAKLLGPVGALIAAVAVIIACLTTAMTLAVIFSDYFRKDLCKEKISAPVALILTLLITTVFANLGFKGIAAFLGPILQIVYPGLILLTFLNLGHILYGWKVVKLPVFLTFAISTLFYITG